MSRSAKAAKRTLSHHHSPLPLERNKIAHGGLEVQVKVEIPLRHRHTGVAQEPADLRVRHPALIAQLGIRPAEVVRGKNRVCHFVGAELLGNQ